MNEEMQTKLQEEIKKKLQVIIDLSEKTKEKQVSFPSNNQFSLYKSSTDSWVVFWKNTKSTSLFIERRERNITPLICIEEQDGEIKQYRGIAQIATKPEFFEMLDKVIKDLNSSVEISAFPRIKNGNTTYYTISVPWKREYAAIPKKVEEPVRKTY